MDTIADRGHTDPQPNPWDITAFYAGLLLPFNNPNISDDLLLVGVDAYLQYYIEGDYNVTHNSFANADL
jgi:hypothetical protein